MANPRPNFNLGDFISDEDVMAYRNMYPGYTPLNDPEEGPSRQPRSNRRRHDRSPSESRSRSHSRARKQKNARDVPPDYDAVDPPTPPEELPNQDYFDEKRPHPHPHPRHPHPHPPHHHPGPHGPGGPPPPPGAGGPPHPPPGAGPHEHGHGHGPWSAWGPWSGPGFGAHGRHHGPWGGPRHHGHHRGGWGGRGRGCHGRGGRGGRGAFPNMFSYGPWTEMLNNTARGDMNGMSMKDMAAAFAEQFGWMGKDEGKDKRAGEGEEDVEVDFEPAADVFDTPGAYLVHVSLPGAKKEDISVTWDEKSGQLRVQGVLTRRVEDGMMECLEVSERDVGLFRKVVKLGGEGLDAVDEDALSGKMEEGVLIVRVGKKMVEEEFVQVKKVDIQ